MCLVLLLLILITGKTNAQLANQINLTVDGIATVRNASTLLDSSFFTSKYSQAIFDIIASLQKYGKQAGNYSDISAALTAAIVDTSALIVSERHSITNNTTLSGVSSIIAIRNGVFNITSGDTLTISVPFKAGMYQVFEGAGVVQFTDGVVPVVEVEWFGSGQAGVNKAIQSLTATGGNVRFSNAISITDSILIDKHNTHFYGANKAGSVGVNKPQSIINITGAGTYTAIVVTGGNCLLENFTLDGQAAKNGGDGIGLESRSTIRNVQIVRMGKNGIRMGRNSNNMNGWVLDDLIIGSNDSSGLYIHDDGVPNGDANAGAAYSLHCHNNGLDGVRLEVCIDNHFYNYRGDFNTGYGIRLVSGAKGNVFYFPYLEVNTTGTGIIESGALENFIFGTRQGTDDGWTDNETSSNDNVIFGRTDAVNDQYVFQGNVGFEDLHLRPPALGSDVVMTLGIVGDSYSIGIDEDDGDQFKISYSASIDAVPGTLDRLIINSSGSVVVTTDGELLGVGASTSENIHMKFVSGSNLGSILTSGNLDDIQIGDGATKIGIGTGSPQSDLDVAGAITADTYNFAADAQADDDYEIALPGISALTTGLMVTWTANTANTGGATLEITSVGLLDAVLKLHDQALVTGDIEAGQVVVTVWDGTNWQMTSQIAQ